MKNSAEAEAEVESSDNADDDQFEFWMVGNPLPSFPQPHHLLTADQLFADGIILPLHSLTVDDHHNASLPTQPPPSPLIPPSCSGKKWKHINIFASRPKRNNCKAKINSGATANITATTTTTTADQLNIIHIWPFSRSRSAGNTLPRPTLTTSTTRFQNYVKACAIRKSSSAPCSRSNSRGDQEAEAEPEPDAEAEEESSPKTNTSAAAPPPKKKWGPLVGGGWGLG